MALEDYKDVVGAATGFVTFCQMFSGVFLCKDIYVKGSTNGTPIMPFMGGFVLSVLFYQHALLIGDLTMKTVNIGGLLLNVSYLLFYYLWTSASDKKAFYKDFSKGVALISVLLGYVYLEDPAKVEYRFGLILTAMLLFLIASPLFSLGDVIRKRSTESLPFPMILSGFVVSLHWLLYGYIIKNQFVVFQNLFASSLGFVQLMLFVIFPSKKEKVLKVQ